MLALVASVVHLTGDPSILRGPIRPRQIVFNEFDGGLTEAEQASLRSAALTAVLAYRDGGSVPPSAPPDDAVVRELMEWLAAEPVHDDYAALFLEELDLAGADPRRIEVPTPDAISVLVIGCGMSGLLAGVRLQQAGIPFDDRREEPRRRWHLVREHVSRLPGRRRQPLLLLLVRAEPRLRRLLRPTARAARVLPRRHGAPRHRAARPVEHRGGARGVGRRRPALAGQRARR